jgi:hypothetical protein
MSFSENDNYDDLFSLITKNIYYSKFESLKKSLLYQLIFDFKKNEQDTENEIRKLIILNELDLSRLLETQQGEKLVSTLQRFEKLKKNTDPLYQATYLLQSNKKVPFLTTTKSVPCSQLLDRASVLSSLKLLQDNFAYVNTFVTNKLLRSTALSVAKMSGVDPFDGDSLSFMIYNSQTTEKDKLAYKFPFPGSSPDSFVLFNQILRKYNIDATVIPSILKEMDEQLYKYFVWYFYKYGILINNYKKINKDFIKKIFGIFVTGSSFETQSGRGGKKILKKSLNSKTRKRKIV